MVVESSAICGDKGNPHYGKELEIEAEGKPWNLSTFTILCRINIGHVHSYV